MVRTVCRRLSVDPGRTMVIADTVADMQMARAGGAGYANGYCQEEVTVFFPVLR